jgi:DNA-binding IscR family transcriptional regulator
MTPPDGLLYTDQRVLVALARLLAGRDQATSPITQTEIAEAAIVSLRTVHFALNRLTKHGLVITGAERGGGRPLTYALSLAALQIVEEHNGQNKNTPH